jgi:DNA-binding NarL/FixJ family response regulator
MNTDRKITLMLTDDHPMLRKGLMGTLSLHAGMEVIGEFGSVAHLMQALVQQQPDILLLDLHMPGMRGDEAVSSLIKQYPAMKIIILTGNNSAFNAKMLLDMGVSGYLVKNAEDHLLINAIEEVYGGNIFVSPELKQRLLRMAKQAKGELLTAEGLTNREVEVLKLAADELTNQQIADRLQLSLRTIENYRLILMQKLGVRNLAGMIKKGIQLGLIE